MTLRNTTSSFGSHRDHSTPRCYPEVVSDPDGEAEQASQEGGKSQHLTKSPVKRQSIACEQSTVGAEGVIILVVDLDHPKI